MYGPGAGAATGYENAALFTAGYPGAEHDSIFSFTALAGAIYSVSSSSFYDPADLIIYNDEGDAIAVDDSSGFYGTDHLTFIAPYTGIYYVDAAWVQGDYYGAQAVTLSILEDLDPIMITAVGGTSRADVLDGTKDDDDMFGYGGADSLFGGRGDDYINGGAGMDVAFYNGRRADFAISSYGDSFFVTDRSGTEGEDLLVNIERLEFADVNVALDINGVGGQAYRLYQAAFDRTPDKIGLGYWIAQLDSGATLASVANAFIASTEFRASYGARPGNLAIVTELYENVLNRVPDQAGVNYWVNMLDKRMASLADVLVAFSESQENYTQLVGVMANGFEYQPWG
jgi:Ca2+-binding RTX toxin-like protein